MFRYVLFGHIEATTHPCGRCQPLHPRSRYRASWLPTAAKLVDGGSR